MSAPSVYVIYYSTWGHVQTMAHEVVKGLVASGVNAKLFQVRETLPQDVLEKMHAPPKAEDVPYISAADLVAADGFLFGMPTRFGGVPAQMKSFFDSCGQLWFQGALYVHKFWSFSFLFCLLVADFLLFSFDKAMVNLLEHSSALAHLVVVKRQQLCRVFHFLSIWA
jgi:NAD(P)H-dependent FMN reductase